MIKMFVTDVEPTDHLINTAPLSGVASETIGVLRPAARDYLRHFPLKGNY